MSSIVDKYAEAIRQRVNASMAKHRERAKRVHDALDDLLSVIETQQIAVATGTAVDDGTYDLELDLAFDQIVSRAEAMRSATVDTPRIKSVVPQSADNHADEEDHLSNLIASNKDAVILGGEVDTIKLERLRQATGLGKRLVWVESTTGDCSSLEQSVSGGNVSCVVIVSGLISHSITGNIMPVLQQHNVPRHVVHKPGIATLLAALTALDQGASQMYGRVAHPYIRGPYLYDTIAAHWFQILDERLSAVSMGTWLSVADIAVHLGTSVEDLEGSERRKIGAVMTPLGWRRERRNRELGYTKHGSKTIIASR